MRVAVLSLLLFPIFANAAKEPVIGNPKAPRGGTLYLSMVAEPGNLNPINQSEMMTQQLLDWVVEPLLQVNPETNDLVPGLADKFQISKDSLTYTFHLRDGAKFSDGSLITVEDLKFSFECLSDPAYQAVTARPYVEDIARVETPDRRTIRIVLRKKYYLNLEAFGQQIRIVPHSVYGDPTKQLNKTMVGSGPYKIGEYLPGKSIELVRNDNWWGYKSSLPEVANKARFDRVVFRFVQDEDLRLEMLKKGQLDMMDFVQPETYVQKATGSIFGSKIIKHQEENQDPINKMYGYVGWNLRKPMFQDKKVRIALAELMNRPLMNEKFRFGLSDLAAGPTWFRNKEIVDPSVKPLPFDPADADRLLKEAGWGDRNKDGVRERILDGIKTELRFTLLLAAKDAEKYFTIYKEDLKKAGIAMDIKVLDWGEFAQLVNEQNFDAFTMSWSMGTLEPDLKSIWHSSSAVKGGSNFIGYSNSEVDKLIDQAREEMNKQKRLKIWRKAYKLIADDAPYAFTFSTRYDLYMVWNYVGMTKGTLAYDRGQYWWWRMAP